MNQDKDFSQSGFTNSPIFFLLAGEHDQRKDGKANCTLRTTWLRMMSLAVPRSPQKTMTMMAGMMASPRVMQAAKPGLEADVEEAFHHDLASERSGERRVLAGSKEREGEDGAGTLTPSIGVRSL